MERPESTAESISHGFFGWLPRVPFVPLATVIVTGALLAVVNQSADDWLGMREYRLWIVIVFLVALILVIAQACHLAWEHYLTRTGDSDKLRRLRSLTPSEKDILRRYIDGSSRSRDLRCSTAPVIALNAAEIVIDKTPLRNDPEHTFVIAEWAWQYLTKHRSLIERPKEPE